jgi:hypothetical protein
MLRDQEDDGTKATRDTRSDTPRSKDLCTPTQQQHSTIVAAFLAHTTIGS